MFSVKIWIQDSDPSQLKVGSIKTTHGSDSATLAIAYLCLLYALSSPLHFWPHKNIVLFHVFVFNFFFSSSFHPSKISIPRYQTLFFLR